MKKRIWLLCAALIAFCCVLLFWRSGSERAKAGAGKDAGAAGPITQNPSPASNAGAPVSGQTSAAPLLNAQNIAHSPIEESNGAYQKILGVWQTPIDFYGRVIDENSNAVAGANISFHWVETPDAGGNREAQTLSDNDGLFSLHGARGPSLSVIVSKAGYYSSSEKDHPVFKYGSFATGDYSPNSLEPVIFHLHTKGTGAPLIRVRFPSGIGQIAQLRHDGTPIEINLFDGQKAAAGTGQLKLELLRDISHPNAKTFDWLLQVSVPGGGLVQTSDEFALEAPQAGYQPVVKISMNATNGNWSESFTGRFYVQLPGPKFARVDLFLSAYNGAFTVQSDVNPSGARNLEYDPGGSPQQQSQQE